MIEVRSLEEFNAALKDNLAVLAFFSSCKCNVCSVLKPKVNNLILSTYSKVRMLHINMEEMPKIHGQYRIFTAPTIIVFFEGRLAFMKGGNIRVDELERLLERPYMLLFEK
jgi:Thioredoxin domain-containing protein